MFSTLRTRCGIPAFIIALVLLSAAPAAASYETVDLFGGSLTVPPKDPKNGNPIWPEEAQLGGVSGMAINRTGAGGVAPGTLYTAGYSGSLGWHAARYSPEGEFELAWTSFSRCGPKSGEPPNPPANPNCKGVEPSGSTGIDVEINQATGDVYVRFETSSIANVVRIYNPDASKLIAEFGERDSNGTIAASPAKFHGAGGVGGIAVNDEGVVYLSDEDKNFFHRLMVFRPETPGDYEHYVYAGQANDIASDSPGTPGTAKPVLDELGNIYTVSSDNLIREFDPTGTLVCSFEEKKGGITSMTVNPATGEPFHYSVKDRKIHQLAACNGEGKFVETGTFNAVPQRSSIDAMAFNPLRQYEPSRPVGVLYAGAGESCPPIGSCPAEAEGRGALGYVLAPPKEFPPEVVSEAVTQVTKTSATLGAQINPKGTQTTYAFQYIDQAAWEANEASDRFAGAIEAPVGGAVLGSGQVALSAAAAIASLVPGTSYHYRVIATSHCSVEDPSKVCEDTGADQAFRSFPVEATGLLDNRAWELVSPTQKGGGQVLPAVPLRASCGSECKPGLAAHRFPTQISPDGRSIAYQGTPFTLNEGVSEYDEHISRRTPTGWQTTHLSPPLAGDSGGVIFEAFALDPELDNAILYATNPSLTAEAPAEYLNLFGVRSDDRLGLEPLLKATPPNRPPKGVESFEREYVGASDDLSRVFFAANDALTEESPFAPEAKDGGATKFNLYEWSEGELRLVNVQPGNAETIPGAVFGSGTQLGVSFNPPGDFANAISPDGSRVFWSDESGQAYVRENGETTLEIPDHTGKFLSASKDGSKVMLSDGVVYDLESEASTDLTEGKGGFQGIAGQSGDFSHIYFVDTAVLDEAPNQEGEKAQAGKPNLYAWSEGAPSYVATLLATDNAPVGGGSLSTWNASPVLRSAEASPDGRWLAFDSQAELTGIDSVGACKFDPNQNKWVGSVPCVEAFLYDSQTGKLTCASCNPTGEHPHGGSALLVVGHAEGSQEQPRYLTDEGRLFFDSSDALSVNDTNGNVEDVYQYEPKEVGSCTKNGGCVSLISAGHEPNDSNFLAADASGENVFFTTRDRLSLKDKDDLIDLYVAREDGGIPAETELARGECQGEACVPTYSPPNDPTPGSSSLEGAGNVDEGKARKKKAHKKKHAKKKRKHAKKHKRAAKHNRGGVK
ncbi:MAG: hypothetical protein QOF13_124 [Solirubrobacterales bacterium]|jgi:hypothetical protein|nr:hypothetical protein [Solirubrobacterales bacterium]